MKVLLSVYDGKAQEYLPCFTAPSVGAGMRAVSDEIRRGGEGNMLASHPGDFQLFRLGVFDEQSGEIVPEKSLVCECSDLVGS